jgi:hypothetical protein
MQKMKTGYFDRKRVSSTTRLPMAVASFSSLGSRRFGFAMIFASLCCEADRHRCATAGEIDEADASSTITKRRCGGSTMLSPRVAQTNTRRSSWQRIGSLGDAAWTLRKPSCKARYR